MSLFRFLKFRKKGALEREGTAASKRRREADQVKVRGQVFSQTSMVATVIIVVLIVLIACIFSIAYRPTWALEPVEHMKVPHNRYAEIGFEYHMPPDERTKIKKVGEVNDIYRLDSSSLSLIQKNFADLFSNIQAADMGISKDGTDDEPPENPLYDHFSQKQVVLLGSLLGTEDKQKVYLKNLKDLFMDGIIPEAEQHRSTIKITVINDRDRFADTDFDKLLTPESVGRILISQICSRFQISENSEIRRIAEIVGRVLITPNLTYDAPRTLKARQDARDSVPMRTVAVKQGELILKKGEAVSKEDLIKIKAYRKILAESLDSREYLIDIAVLSGLSLLVLLAGAFFCGTAMLKICGRKSYIALIGITTALNLVLVWGTEQIFLNVVDGPHIFLYAALPLMFAPVLLA